MRCTVEHSHKTTISHPDFFSAAAQPYLSEILCAAVKTNGSMKISFKADTVEWSCEPSMLGGASTEIEAFSGIAPIVPNTVQISPNLIMPLVFNCQSISFSHKSLRYFFKGDRTGVQFFVYNLIANLSIKGNVTVKINNDVVQNHANRKFYYQLRKRYFNALKYFFEDDIAKAGGKTQELLTINAFFPINNLLTGFLKRESTDFRRNINLLRLGSPNQSTNEEQSWAH